MSDFSGKVLTKARSEWYNKGGKGSHRFVSFLFFSSLFLHIQPVTREK